MPIKAIQDGLADHFVSGHGLPTIMCSSSYNIEDKNSLPVYYSLQHPLMMNMALNTRRQQTRASELRELSSVLRQLQDEVSKSERFTGTIYQAMSHLTSFTSIHYKDKVVEKDMPFITTENLFDLDQRFNKEHSIAANFFRGCIMVSKKKDLRPDRSKKFAI